VRNEEQDDAEQNILDTEEHGSDVDFESPEAQMEVAKFRKGFARWVEEPRSLGPRVGKTFITLFDIYWELIQQVGNRPAYNISLAEHKWKYNHDKIVNMKRLVNTPLIVNTVKKSKIGEQN